MNAVQSLEARRLFSTYAVDPTFGDGSTQAGRLNIPSDGQPLIAVRDGRIVAAANYYDEFNGPIDNIRRYHGDGTFDRSFNAVRAGDAANLHVAGVDALARPLFEWPGTGKAALTRYLPKGVNDKTFDGVIAPPNSVGRQVTVSRVEPQPGGTMLGVVGVTTPAKKVKDRVTELYLFRLNETTGKVDPTFGINGYLALGHSVEAKDVQFQADGKGRTYLGFAEQNATYRLRANGSRDKAWGDSGKVRRFPDFGFAIDAGGNYLSWWADDSFNHIRRTLPSGAPDDAFNATIDRYLDVGAATEFNVLSQPDGTLFVQINNNLLKFNADGTPDNRFDDDGVTTLPSSQPILAVLPAGRFLQLDDIGESVYAIAPAQAVTLGADRTLRITGTAEADQVSIGVNGSTVNVSLNGASSHIPAKSIDSISAVLYEGDNSFISSAPMNTNVIAGNGHNLIYTGDGIDFVTTGKRYDRIATGKGADYIFPGGGNNLIDSGRGGGTISIDEKAPAGHNVITGRDGDDWRVEFQNQSSAEIKLDGSIANIDLAGGNNVIDLAMSRYAIVNTGNGNDRIDLRRGGNGVFDPDQGFRHPGDDDIHPGGGNDTVFAGTGQDSVYDERPLPPGVSDDDVYNLGDGDDILSDVNGNNTAAGGAGDDTITTGPGRDTLRGEDGDDRLVGGTGRDVIDGGAGNDFAGLPENDDVLTLIERRS